MTLPGLDAADRKLHEMSEKAKWVKGEYSDKLRLGPSVGAGVMWALTGDGYVAGSDLFTCRTRFPTVDAAKAYAESELRRILTEALARLPEDK